MSIDRIVTLRPYDNNVLCECGSRYDYTKKIVFETDAERTHRSRLQFVTVSEVLVNERLDHWPYHCSSYH